MACRVLSSYQCVRCISSSEKLDMAQQEDKGSVLGSLRIMKSGNVSLQCSPFLLSHF